MVMSTWPSAGTMPCKGNTVSSADDEEEDKDDDEDGEDEDEDDDEVGVSEYSYDTGRGLLMARVCVRV